MVVACSWTDPFIDQIEMVEFDKSLEKPWKALKKPNPRPCV